MTWVQKSPYYMERGGYRISKAITPDGPIYTAWARDGSEWVALHYGTREECERAIAEDSDEPDYIEGCR